MINIYKKPSVYTENVKNSHLENNAHHKSIVKVNDVQLHLNIKNTDKMQNNINNDEINDTINDTINDIIDDNNVLPIQNEVINMLLQNKITTDNKSIVKNSYNKYNMLFDIKPIFNHVHNIYPKNQPLLEKNTFTNINIQNINIQNINTLKNKAKKIVHVYQENYINNKKPTGFGDFIRSCVFIIQFCSKNNIEYDIIINHPIALFLNNFHYTYKKSNLFVEFLHKNTNYFTYSNWIKTNFDKHDYKEQFILSENIYNNYIEYLSSLPIINDTLYSYNVLFPIYKTTKNEIDIIKKLLEPTFKMSSYVEDKLSQLNLINKKFIVIQIRSGDEYINDKNKNNFFSEYLNNIYSFINNFNPTHNDVFLIADNNRIKYLIHQKFPQIKILFNNITHIGNSNDSHKEELKNTLLDFYIMSKSSSIFSITSYLHGSGFSYWCSQIYNVPYNCVYFKN